MIVAVVVVGAVKGALGPAVTAYETRAKRYWKLDVREVAHGPRGNQSALEAEGDRLLKAVGGRSESIVLSRRGKPMSSEGLARYLESQAVSSSPGPVFLIGGAAGISDGVREATRHEWSLSHLTLPHEMARLVLAEQLYRAGTILRGEPYHRGARP